MGRKPGEPDTGHWGCLPLLLLVLLSCSLVYIGLSFTFRSSNLMPISGSGSSTILSADEAKRVSIGQREAGDGDENCCRGIGNMELWGAAVKWGTDFKFNSSRECCNACKEMCGRGDGPCLSDSWVFCGDRARCGEKFGEGSAASSSDRSTPITCSNSESEVVLIR